MAEPAVWFYALENKQHGPVTLQHIKDQIRCGAIRKKTLVWREGMPGWAKLADTELNKKVFPPPPPPARRPRHGSTALRQGGAGTTQTFLGDFERKRDDIRSKRTRIVVKSDLRRKIEQSLGEQSSKSLADRSRDSRVAPPPKTNILSCIVEGKGLVEAIRESSETDLCLYLPAICLAIESTPIWCRYHRDSSLEALKRRVMTSTVIAQSMSLILRSHSVKNPRVFDDIKTELTKANSGDTLLYDFPLNLLMDKANRKKLKKGFVIESKGRAYHPFHQKLVKEVRVLDIFKSNARPVLVSMLSEEERGWDEKKILQSNDMLVIVKHGDDMRQDVASMLTFRLFNHMWTTSKLSYERVPIRCHAYYCCATGENVGAIEYVRNCLPLSDLKQLRPLKPSGPEDADVREKVHRIIATGAGSYIAAFVLGIRDRHADNIMLRRDGVMFHIDFGRVFGDTVLMDTSSFAIPKEFRDEIGNNAYGEFTQNCIKAFRILRQPQNLRLIMGFAPTMFSSMFNRERVQDFLKGSLMLNKDVKSACKRLMKKIENAPDSYKTYFKNVVHKLAQRNKS